ncbi:MAG: hypothetical protein WAL84_00625 [Candidatus Dormiibacterota bacterium]
MQLLGGEALVRSPCLLDGDASHVKREVDAGVLVGLGASNLLMVVEVRDRARVQGVDWIEQLISKRDDVGADVLVAVSSSGFTAAAVRLGTAHRLRLWRVNQISRAELSALWDFESDLVEVGEMESLEVYPIIQRADVEKLGPFKMIRSNGSEDLQLPELLMSLPRKKREEATVRLDRDRTRLQCIIRMPRTNGYALKLRSGDVSVDVAGVLVNLVTVVTSRYEVRAAWHHVRSDGLETVYVERDHPILGESPILKQIKGEPEWDTRFFATGRPLIPRGTKDDLLLESTGNVGSFLVDEDGKPRFVAESEWAAASSIATVEEWSGSGLVTIGLPDEEAGT